VSRYGLLLDGVWPGKHKPVHAAPGHAHRTDASIKGVVVLVVTALLPHGVVLHRVDQGANAECFYLLAPETPSRAIRCRSFAAARKAAALPLLLHQTAASGTSIS
jgi:hypothetical protein